MALCLVRKGITCNFNRFPQNFLPTKWSLGSLTCRGKQFHNSPVLRNLDVKSKLVDKGRKSILRLKRRDNVPEDYQLIYKASMELTMRLSYPTFISCCLGLFGALIYREFNKENIQVPKGTGRDGSIKFFNPKLELVCFSIGLILFTLAGSSIILKYPFRVYKHYTKKEYIAVYVSPVILMLRRVHFKKAAPTKFKNPLYSLFDDCHYVLDDKKKTLFLPQFFRVPKDLSDMCDERPIDTS